MYHQNDTQINIQNMILFYVK